MWGLSWAEGLITTPPPKAKFDYTESDHYCERCDVRWRGRDDSVCWSCEGRDESLNLTASGKAHVMNKYGATSPSSAMSARFSEEVENENQATGAN